MSAPRRRRRDLARPEPQSSQSTSHCDGRKCTNGGAPFQSTLTAVLSFASTADARKPGANRSKNPCARRSPHSVVAPYPISSPAAPYEKSLHAYCFGAAFALRLFVPSGAPAIEEIRSVRCREVILAAGQSTVPLAAKLAELISLGHAPAVTTHTAITPGNALRFLRRNRPDVLLICVTTEDLRHSSAIISAVRERLPGLPILAIAAEHDASVERSVRQGGAAFYFALSADASEIVSTLETLTVSRPLAYDDPVPARARGRPPRPPSPINSR